MVKDFAKKNLPHTPVRKRNTGLVAVIVMIAILAPFVMFLGKYRNLLQKKTAPLVSSQAALKQFDFYTLLPNMEVNVAPESVITKSLALSSTPNQYLLQVASVKNMEDAKRLQQKLVNLGYHGSVQRYRDWYRVIVGPYASLNIALQRQRDLYTHKLDSLLLKNKGNYSALVH